MDNALCGPSAGVTEAGAQADRVQSTPVVVGDGDSNLGDLDTAAGNAEAEDMGDGVEAEGNPDSIEVEVEGEVAAEIPPFSDGIGPLSARGSISKESRLYQRGCS
jgi:hypothetical protein